MKEAGLGPKGSPLVQVTRRRRISIGEGGWARSQGISTCPGNQEKESYSKGDGGWAKSQGSSTCPGNQEERFREGEGGWARSQGFSYLLIKTKKRNNGNIET